VTATVLLCLDGGDLRVVQSVVAAGGMAATRRLLERSALVRTETPGRVLELSVWTSLLSGQPVGNDPLSHFERFDPATMGTTFRREGLLEPLWLHLPAAGRGALVLDAPEVHPDPRSAAAASCCWHVHAPVHAPMFTDRVLRARLLARGRPPRLSNPTQLGPEPERAIAGHLERSVEFRVGTLEALGFKRPFTCIGVHELHTAVHALGHHGPDEHWLDPERRSPGLLARPYEAIDGLIERVVERAGAANLVIVFARGIRPADHCGHLVEGLLERAGLLVRRLGAHGNVNRSTRAGLTERARALLPDATRERIAMRVLPESVQQRLAAQRFRDRYAWEQTRAFPIPSWSAGLLRINLADRESAGIVAPGEAEALLARVSDLAWGMVDAETGRALVEEVIRPRERFPGARAEDLPDLIFTWTAGRPPRAARHPQLGTWTATPRTAPWTEHRGAADVLLAGPDVRPGVKTEGDALGLAPTVLALLGSRAPSVMPGEVWSDVVAH
jgi:predicted AlkP superfamily phosphohydrolase/phosphomutase